MFCFNKITIITLLASISCLQANDVNIKVMETNPGEVGVLTLLKTSVGKSGDAAYSYKCTVGNASGRAGCRAYDSMTWPTAHNVELTLRCPINGVTSPISYAEVNFTVSSQSVNCYVSSGGIGYNFIEMKVQSWGTVLLNYDAYFYTY